MKNNIFAKIFSANKANKQLTNAESLNDTSNVDEFERCIICGALANVPKSTPIEWRDNYEVGFGQLCVECAKNQHKLFEKENSSVSAQITHTDDNAKKSN